MKKIALLLSLMLISGFVAPSFAQMENKDVHVHPAKLGDRKPVMNFMLPEKIEAKQDFTLSMILYDEKNKKNFQHVTIKLAILRNDVKTPLLNALFYDKNGQIKIDFKYQSFDKPRVIVQAPQETYLGGYMSEFGSRIVARQNVFADGLYTLEATVISIDSPAQFIDKEIVFKKEIRIDKNEPQKSEITTGNKTKVSDSDKGTQEKSLKEKQKKVTSKDKSKTSKDKTKLETKKLKSSY
ncbi:MAG: hypothetical protein ACREAE_03225 [Nitrosopumilaceae archaeon]